MVNGSTLLSGHHRVGQGGQGEESGHHGVQDFEGW
jgi:hypothetical protein